MNESAPHLTRESFSLAPGAEWVPPIGGWWLFKVQAGSGYLLSAGAVHQLDSGAVIRLSPSWLGRIRASQISVLHMSAFLTDPSRFPGLVSLPDEKRFRAAAGDAAFAFRLFPSSHSIASAADSLFRMENNDLLFRVSALQVFLQTFEHVLGNSPKLPTDRGDSAALRLKQALQEIPTADLIHLDLNQLVQRVRCTPRHFSRLFRDLVGVSFREKQTEVRLNRALQLLASTDSKVVDVAFESGFESVSLFNTLFKRRFRVAPRLWRHRFRKEERNN